MFAQVTKAPAKENAGRRAGIRRDRAGRADRVQEPDPPAGELEGRHPDVGPQWDFGKVSILVPGERRSSASLYVQRKLGIGGVTDPLEQEADRVADQVMRMPAPAASIAAAPPQISRKCAACAEEEQKTLQRKESEVPEHGVSEAPASGHQVLRARGQPLDDATRAYIEPRFGTAQQLVLRKLDTAAVQPELSISKPGDAYEQEADQVADKIRAMVEPATTEGKPLSPRPAAPIVQRACAACAAEEENILRKEAPGQTVTPAAARDAPPFGLVGPGQPLPKATRQYFEPRFGRDFAEVRIHVDAAANQSAQAFNALAYTFGRHIVFAQGQFAPGSDRGRRLLAHELEHVVQQRGGLSNRIQRQVTGARPPFAKPVRPLCTGLFPPNLALIPGGGEAVHERIREDFMGHSLTMGGIDIVIPGASAAPLRTGGLCGKPSSVIPPQIIGGEAGAGKPDLAMLTRAGILLVAEIKPAVYECLIDGETQALGYINAGNATDPPQVAWRAEKGIKVVSPMLEMHYPPPSIPVGDVRIETAWCEPGLLAYTVYRRAVRVPEEQPVRVPSQEPVRVASPEPDVEYAQIAENIQSVLDVAAAAAVIARLRDVLADVTMAAELVETAETAEDVGYFFARILPFLEEAVE
jgi:hypothetical protein